MECTPRAHHYTKLHVPGVSMMARLKDQQASMLEADGWEKGARMHGEVATALRRPGIKPFDHASMLLVGMTRTRLMLVSQRCGVVCGIIAIIVPTSLIIPNITQVIRLTGPAANGVLIESRSVSGEKDGSWGGLLEHGSKWSADARAKEQSWHGEGCFFSR